MWIVDVIKQEHVFSQDGILVRSFNDWISHLPSAWETDQSTYLCQWVFKRVQFPVFDDSMLFHPKILCIVYLNCRVFGLFHPHLCLILLNRSSIKSWDSVCHWMICFSSQPNELNDICEVPWLTVHRCSPVPNSWCVGQFQYLAYKLICLWWVVIECHCKLLDLIWVVVQIWLHFCNITLNQPLSNTREVMVQNFHCSVAISSLSFKDVSRSYIVLIFSRTLLMQGGTLQITLFVS